MCMSKFEFADVIPEHHKPQDTQGLSGKVRCRDICERCRMGKRPLRLPPRSPWPTARERLKQSSMLRGVALPFEVDSEVAREIC